MNNGANDFNQVFQPVLLEGDGSTPAGNEVTTIVSGEEPVGEHGDDND